MRRARPKRPFRQAAQAQISKKQQAIYRRRRIVAGTVLLLIIALIVFCVYSLSQGIGAVNTMIHHDEVYAISRDATPAPKKVSNVRIARPVM